MYTEVWNSLESVTRRKSFNRMEERDSFVQPIWTVCLDRNVSCAVNAGI